MSDVEITIDDQPAVSPAPEVVVIPEPSAESVPVWAVDLIERMTRLEQSVTLTASVVEEVAEVAVNAADASEVALDAADTAITLAVDANELANEAIEIGVVTADEAGVLPAVIEETAADPVPDITPQKAHPLFRSWEDWRSTIGG